MKYILEIEVADGEKLFAEKFFKNISFVKKINAFVPGKIESTTNSEPAEIDELGKPDLKQSIIDFSGVLSESDYQALKQHTEQARNEWNRVI